MVRDGGKERRKLMLRGLQVPDRTRSRRIGDQAPTCRSRRNAVRHGLAVAGAFDQPSCVPAEHYPGLSYISHRALRMSV